MKMELMKKLQMKIEEMSVNSLTNIHPERLMQWMNIPHNDFLQFVDELYKERLISYKYLFKCTCGNECTVYHQKILRELYICKECGSEYSIDMISKKAKIVYDLDKYEIMKYFNDNISLQDDGLNISKIIPINNQKTSESKGRKQMEVFMGSSQEAVSDMEDIGVKIENIGEKVLLWNDVGEGIFPANANIIDGLIQITKRVDAAVFIFNEDDKYWHHNSLKESKAVRDNVLFEYGLFCGALGKEKVCFVCKGSPKLASDLNGIKYIDGTSGNITIKKSLEDWFSAM